LGPEHEGDQTERSGLDRCHEWADAKDGDRTFEIVGQGAHLGADMLQSAGEEVGCPKQVADQMEEWFTAPACDGFVLAAASMPGAYDDVVRLPVPELQRRGLFQKEYAGPTLRDNLGLPIPRAADWHAARQRPME
jgi:alkanesulfonate monooxygenase SsuD/methylene tetrahydromethanopterin reductase-like flavin-dependent oxidoreductase (luciferase family)